MSEAKDRQPTDEDLEKQLNKDLSNFYRSMSQEMKQKYEKMFNGMTNSQVWEILHMNQADRYQKLLEFEQDQ